MRVFDSMIFFGIALLIAGIFFSWDAIKFSQNCVGQDGIEVLTQCPSIEPPWNMISLYVLPGIVLIGSAIILKRKNRYGQEQSE